MDARLFGKKYYPERSGGVEIFFQKPAERSEAALQIRTAIRNLLCQKAYGGILEDLKETLGIYSDHISRRVKD